MNSDLIRKLSIIFIFIFIYNFYCIYANKLYAKNFNKPNKQPLIKIAIIVPLTGKYADYGKNLLIAANQAMHDYGKTNSNLNTQVELIPFDDKCDPTIAKSIAYEIIKDRKIKIIIGHVCANTTLITSKIYAKQGLLHIIPTVTEPKITENGITTLFRMCGKDDIQAQHIANFISKKFADKRIAILHNSDPFSKLLAESVQESLAILKIAPTLYQSINLEELNTYSKIINFIKKLKKLNINLIFFSGYYIPTANLLKIMYHYKVNIPFVTGGNIVTPGFLKLLPNPKLIAGTIMSFHKLDLKKFNPQPDQSIFGYAAMQVILEAIKHNSNNFNSRILANWLHHNKVSTILGEKSWDTNGEIINAEFNMYIWDEKGNYWELN